MANKIAPNRSVPKVDKRQRTRSKLLEAARELVREKGYERTTLEEVASRAGMTTGELFVHTPNAFTLGSDLSDNGATPASYFSSCASNGG